MRFPLAPVTVTSPFGAITVTGPPEALAKNRNKKYNASEKRCIIKVSDYTM